MKKNTSTNKYDFYRFTVPRLKFVLSEVGGSLMEKTNINWSLLVDIAFGLSVKFERTKCFLPSTTPTITIIPN